MSPPARTHLISLCLVLALTLSLVWGQTPTHFTLSGVTVTGPLPITNVGRGIAESPSLICHTTSATNTTNTVWLFPDGSIITQVLHFDPATDSFIFRRDPNNNYVLLRRGPSVRSPGGEYCCGSATDVNERLCIDLVVDCETPPSISNGSPGTTASTLIGQTVTYTCGNGYQISPGVTMTTASCLATGNWETVTCSAVDCGSLNVPTNGGVTTSSGTTFRSTATYSCTTGYTLTGDMTRTCGSDGVWTLPEPSCPPVECESLNGPTNGRVTTPSGTTFMNIATYSCTTGYILTGDMTRTCGSDGVWTLTEPSCPAVDCGTPPSISNGSPGSPTKTTFEGTVTYTCNNGYQISPGVTMGTASCLATGNWETVQTCLAIRVIPSTDDPPTAGQSYSLTCTVTGADSLNPTISYQWTRGSTTVGTNAILTFDTLVLSDTGQYRCEVTLSSNLLSEIMRAVSDMFDLEIPTVFIQLLFRGIHNCVEYRQNNANGIIQDITNGLTEAIRDQCGCVFTAGHISKSFVQCFSDQIAFRAQLNQTTQANTEELVSYIDQWARNPGHLIVQGSLLQLNTTCSLLITDQFDASECPIPLSGNQPTTGAVGTLPSSAPPSSQSDNIGAIVGGVVVLILGLAVILAVTAVIIAYLVLKQRRMGGVDLKTPDIPLTDKGQSSTAQTCNGEDVTYEEIDVPHPQKGSYEYSQCQAYAPTLGEGVVNVV